MPAPELAIDNRFELGERVGKGAFGEVLRAIDRRTGAVVAIKRLLDHQDDPLIVDRFQREARLLQRISSPHVVGYVAHGDDARGRPCIALEWLDGCDLSRVVRARRLHADEALDVVRQAALGLHALHDRGIVHRDVKPANFFIVPADDPGAMPRVKLLDLGIARTHADATLTAVGARIGTPSYMSPEQARGEEGITVATDIFSLGVVLYELLTGARPFTGDQSLVVLAKIVLHEPPRLVDVRPDLPPALADLVARAMAKSPAARFDSARAFAKALAEAPIPDRRGSSAPPVGPAAAFERADDDEPTTAPSSSLSATREQRVVTAVFAGFANTLDPERSMVTFHLMAMELGGACHATIGRQMIAVFGATRSTGDEALRGARLSLAAARRIQGVQLSVTTGRVHVGEAGLSADAIDRGYAVIPDEPGAVTLDAPTARIVAPQLWVDEVAGGFVLRGERRSIPAPGPRLLGRETPMVGRDRELAMLEALYDECAGEPVARVALITGPAGAGKSRVRYELLRRLSARAEPPTVLVGRGESLRAGSPYGMIAEAIRHAAGILDGEPPRAQERKLAQRIERSAAKHDVARLLDFLGELAGVSSTRSESAALRAARSDPMAMGDAKRMAFEDWILAECARRPVVLVLEDLHWGDVPTVKLLAGALEVARDRPLMVLAIARPDVRETFPDLWREHDPQECRLTALTRSAAERLAREVLGDAVDAATARLIAERSEGNAFYLEEMIRAVAEGKSELPAAVLGMVQARLDALGADCKRVLRAASVFGERFWQAGVAALCGGEGAGLRAALDELVAREVVARRPSITVPGKVELVFRHALVREAAYAMLPPDDRVVGHRLAGEWLESTGGTDAITLAQHYERGAQPLRAAGWYRRAAERALEGNDLDAAVSRAARGVACGAEGEELGYLLVVQAEASRWRGDTDAAIRCGVEATSLLGRGERAWFRAVAEVVAACGRRAAWDDVERWLREAAEAEAAPAARSRQIACLCPGASQLIQAGRYEVADELYERLKRLEIEAGGLEPLAVARLSQLRAFRAFRSWDADGARRSYLEAMTLFETAGHARNACLERINLGFVCAELGELEQAEQVLRQCLSGAERMRLHLVRAYALLNLGRVMMDLERLDEAGRALEQARDMGLSDHVPRLAGTANTQLSLLLYRRGDYAAAAAGARRAADALAVAPPMRAGALAAEARALLMLGRPNEALAAASEAARVIEGGQHEMFDSLVWLVHALSLDAVGDREGATAVVRKARDRLLGAAELIDNARTREAFLKRVEPNAQTLALAEDWRL